MIDGDDNAGNQGAIVILATMMQQAMMATSGMMLAIMKTSISDITQDLYLSGDPWEEGTVEMENFGIGMPRL